VFLKDDDACVTDCAGEYHCIPLCKTFKSPTQKGANDDGNADDWAWENEADCIIPDTITARGNTPCTTGKPIPDPEPRPGIMINGDPEPYSCLWTECRPLCRVVTEASDPAYPDWGWEDNASCVIPGTETANWLPDGDVPRGCKDDPENPHTIQDDCYYKYPPRPCTWPMPEVDFLAPPGTATGPFTVSGAQLIDPNGNPFLIRGLNNSHAWFDTCGQYMAYGALDNIAEAGANAVRVGWAFETIDPVGPDLGEPEKDIIGTTPELLAEILHRIVELKMIAFTAVNDSTGQTDVNWPFIMAQHYTQPKYKELLLAYEPYLLIGIANEWNGSADIFFQAYDMAIQHLRSQGINHTLVVTANDWGQGCDAILDNAAQLLASDPNHNLAFDIHIYTYITYKGGHGGSADMVAGCLDDIAAANIPLIIGEFGHSHSSGPVEWETIIERANANNQSYLPWVWFGDTEYPVLNQNETWDGPLTEWGMNTLPLTGAKATIFE
jgi:mannan endo-1,4-beta-mannosidase